jgi:DNA-binding transcriptional regulator LsrR (DeoR family)
MSIDIDRFEEADPESVGEATNAERVVAFLLRHDDRAWKQAEVAERTGIPRGSIGPVLARLQDRDLVRHKGEYWAITDDRDHLEDSMALHQVTERLDDRHGSEDRSEWVENDTPNRGGEQ